MILILVNFQKIAKIGQHCIIAKKKSSYTVRYRKLFKYWSLQIAKKFDVYPILVHGPNNIIYDFKDKYDYFVDHSEKKVKTNKAAVHEFKRTKWYLTKIVIFLPVCWKKTLFNMSFNSSFASGVCLIGLIQLQNKGGITQRENLKPSFISFLNWLDKRLHINACFCNQNNVYQWNTTQLQRNFN